MPALKVHETDNVATVFEDETSQGTVVDIYDPQGVIESLPAKSDIPFGHKIAIRDINAGEAIVKYGEIIGAATKSIATGEHVHVHNLDSQRGRGDLSNEI